MKTRALFWPHLSFASLSICLFWGPHKDTGDHTKISGVTMRFWGWLVRRGHLQPNTWSAAASHQPPRPHISFNSKEASMAPGVHSGFPICCGQPCVTQRCMACRGGRCPPLSSALSPSSAPTQTPQAAERPGRSQRRLQRRFIPVNAITAD